MHKYFVMHYLVSFLVLQSSWWILMKKRAGCFSLFVFLVFCDCKCSVETSSWCHGLGCNGDVFSWSYFYMSHGMTKSIKWVCTKWKLTLVRVPTSTGKPGKPGKSIKKVPCMEKSWNLKKTETSWKNHGILWNNLCVWLLVFLLLVI